MKKLYAIILATALAGEAASAFDALLTDDTTFALNGHNSATAGALPTLNVDANHTALLKFDLSKLPANTTTDKVFSATLTVFVDKVTTPGTLELEGIQGTWSEAEIPSVVVSPLNNPPTATVTVKNRYVCFDVTELVRSWIGGAANEGMAVGSGGSGAKLALDSKENIATSHSASLDIDLGGYEEAAQGTNGSLPAGVLTNNESGVVLNGSFSGNGGGLTNLNLSLSAGVLTNNESGVVLNGIFSGNGGGLTNLSVGQLPAGLVTNGQSGVVLNGTFSGDGGGLTNLNVAQLPAGVLTNNESAAVTLSNLTLNGALTLPDVTSMEGTNNIDVIYEGTDVSTNLLLYADPVGNVFIGPQAGNAATAMNGGSANTAIGFQALAANTSGQGNTASGTQALSNNSEGVNNTANGLWALAFNTNGQGNTAIGSSALGENTSGAFNIALGNQAGLNITTGSYNIDIGHQGYASDNNVIRIGLGQTATYLVGTVYAPVFTETSDRNAKAGFAPVNPQAVLAKVAALPISEWNFKSDAGTRHIGPMAQDFYSAFDVGTDDKHIATVDEEGVALAAIQWLNQKLETEAKEKDAEFQDLKARLEKLEQLIASKNGGEK